MSQLKCKWKHFRFLQNIDARSDPSHSHNTTYNLWSYPQNRHGQMVLQADISRWGEIWENRREIKHASRAQCYPTGNFHLVSRINSEFDSIFNSNPCVNWHSILVLKRPPISTIIFQPKLHLNTKILHLKHMVNCYHYNILLFIFNIYSWISKFCYCIMIMHEF